MIFVLLWWRLMSRLCFPMFLLSIHLNANLHHMECSKEWPQTKCLCLQMIQVFLKFTAPSWTGGGWMCWEIRLCSFVLSSYYTLCCYQGGYLERAEDVLPLVLITTGVTTPSWGFLERGHKRTLQCPVRMPHSPVRRLQGCHVWEQPWGSAFCPPWPHPLSHCWGLISTAMSWLLLLCPCCGTAQVTPWGPQLMARGSQDRPWGAEGPNRAQRWGQPGGTGLGWAGLGY